MMPSLIPPCSAMARIVVPFMSPVSLKARRAALSIELRRASAVSRCARGTSPVVLAALDCLAMHESESSLGQGRTTGLMAGARGYLFRLSERIRLFLREHNFQPAGAGFRSSGKE